MLTGGDTHRRGLCPKKNAGKRLLRAGFADIPVEGSSNAARACLSGRTSGDSGISGLRHTMDFWNRIGTCHGRMTRIIVRNDAAVPASKNPEGSPGVFSAAEAPSPSRSRPGRLVGVIAVLAAMSIAGCGSGRRSKPPPPFTPGAYVGEGKPSPPTIEVLSPAGSKPITVKAGEKVECSVRVTVAPGGSAPTFMMALFRDAKGAYAGNFVLEPLKKEGDTYTYRSLVKSPHWPGKYRLIFDASTLAIRSQPEGKTEGPPPEPGFFHTTVSAASVEVKKRLEVKKR